MNKTVGLVFILFISALLCQAQDKGYMKYQGVKNSKKIVLAITDFEGRGLAEGEATTLTDAFRSYLINTEVFRVMERGKMDEIMKEQGFQKSGACTDQACMVEMGQLLGVDNIVAGSVGKVGGTYSVNVRLVGVETGEITKTVNKFYKGEIDGLLTGVLAEIANDFASANKEVAAVQVTPQVTPMGPAQPQAAPPPPPPVAAKKGGHGWLFLGLGVVAAGGGAAAYFITQKKKNEDKGPQGTVEITWN